MTQLAGWIGLALVSLGGAGAQGENTVPVAAGQETPLLLEYGVLIVLMLVIIGLMVILYRSVQAHAAQYPPEVGESILRLWEVIGERAKESPPQWDDDVYRVVDPLARAIARMIQEGAEREALGQSDDVNDSSPEP